MIKKSFIEAMDDDFNTPRALVVFYRLVQIANKALAAHMNKSLLTESLDSMIYMTHIFGILEKKVEKEKLPPEAEKLLKERDLARSVKNWKLADDLRRKLGDMGIVVEDLPFGSRWRYTK